MGIITNIQRFSTHDGPGIRTTVFLKGCELRCTWCHNPETQKAGEQIFFNSNQCLHCGNCVNVCPHKAHYLDESGNHKFEGGLCDGCLSCIDVCLPCAIERVSKNMEVDEVVEIAKADKAFYGDKGGVTISGGEPMFQPEFAISILKKCKEEKIHTCMETSGYFDSIYLKELNECCDLFLWDIKDSDPDRHKTYTGVYYEKIWENLLLADSLGAKTILRCILVKGLNDNQIHAKKIAELAASLKNCLDVAVFPHNALSGTKSKLLGLEDTANVSWIPGEDEVIQFRKSILEEIKSINQEKL